jgi:hypothetical protein
MAKELEWVQDPMNQHGYSAALPGRPADQDHHYRVYPSNDRWVYKRKAGTMIGPLMIGAMQGEAPTLDAAKGKLEEDWLTLKRLLAWVRYMVSNPPPG